MTGNVAPRHVSDWATLPASWALLHLQIFALDTRPRRQQSQTPRGSSGESRGEEGSSGESRGEGEQAQIPSHLCLTYVSSLAKAQSPT